MYPINYSNVIIIPLLLILCYFVNFGNSQYWEFAVTTENKIYFYDSTWSIVTTAAHQFNQLSAMTFDETEERIFFNDLSHDNSSIFSLKLTRNEVEGTHLIETFLVKTQNETISSLAYDPVDQVLYWTDRENRKIYYVSTAQFTVVPNDSKSKFTSLPSSSLPITSTLHTPKILFDFAKEELIPDGIAVDICHRKLYWTNSNHKNPTIESSSLDGTQRRVIIDSGLFLPHGIFVDQFSDKIYWVVDQEGSHFSIESANLDGSNRVVILKGLNNVPFSLVTTKDSIYWTDWTHGAIWNISKETKNFQFDNEVNDYNNSTTTNSSSRLEKYRPNKVQQFPSHPRALVVRTGFLSKLVNDAECKVAIKAVKSRLLNVTAYKSTHKSSTEENVHDIFCLNDGKYNPISGNCICKFGFRGNRCEKYDHNMYCLNDGEYNSIGENCICKVGFTGMRCDVDACQNYCVHGTCQISSLGYPECVCQQGFYGERCESYKCKSYCLNGGRCEIVENSPTCHCSDEYTGTRCESNSTEICHYACRIQKYDPEADIPHLCWEYCDDLELETTHLSEEEKAAARKEKQAALKEKLCYDSSYNKTVIFVVIGVLTSLLLVLLITITLRRIYKPARPRIKKTFVVQKKISQTPLTSRPMATEQCEITIENCCNMNICDTPCFDPKLLQSNITFEKNTKEDKKMLINNMEDELY